MSATAQILRTGAERREDRRRNVALVIFAIAYLALLGVLVAPKGALSPTYKAVSSATFVNR